jgi:PAS domain S-box-containing protein
MPGDGGADSSPQWTEPSELRILHVEDDSSFGDLVATFLERDNEAFRVVTETDPVAAVDELLEESRTFDCVVCDYDMPKLDGLEVLARVHEAYPELPFILFTGKGNEEIASDAISAGVTDYLQKDRGTDQYKVLANRIENSVDRYRAERQVDRAFSAMESAHDGISLIDEDEEIQYANSSCADMLGYDRDELIGEHWSILYREEDVQEVYDTLLPAAKEGGWSGRTDYQRKDGRTVTVAHSLSYAEEGALICTISETDDSTALERDLSLKERAMDEAPVGITITDPGRENNPIIYANEHFEALTGYAESEIVGRNCRFLQGPETRREPRRKLRTAVDAGRPVTVELRNYRADGTQFWNRVRIVPLRDESGEIDYFVGFQEDVSELSEIRIHHEERMDQFRGFGDVLAHDMQTPIDVVQGRVELTERTGDLDHLEDAKTALNQLETLTDDLANVMRTGELVNDIERVDVGKVVQAAWATLDPVAASLTVGDPPTIYADRATLERMVENLFGNSLEHGGEAVSVRVGALDDREGFYVADDGPGIPEEQREEVFTPGYTTKSDSTGFGMTSVRQIVVTHGWQITVEDSADGGVRFEITGVETVDGGEVPERP